LDVEVQVQLKAYQSLVDNRLAELLHPESSRPPELAQAMRYACLAPGKRLRPALCLASAAAAGGEIETALNVACAIEMVHCFSLIHDDLPALDNDDLRRGRPTCHVQFGEAVAILAGDALFALAFETIAAPKLGMVPSAEQRLECLRLLTQASGTEGLVAGEAADLLAEGRPLNEETLHFIHTHKTGALISASCEMGAVLASRDRTFSKKLARYGSAVGLAFQIADDILNETSTPEQLGKSAGSDRERSKATYPALVGIEESKRQALALAAEAQEHLCDLPGPTAFLRDLALFAVERMH
jgi:geranylgeranyl diphosphate synthase type II